MSLGGVVVTPSVVVPSAVVVSPPVVVTGGSVVLSDTVVVWIGVVLLPCSTLVVGGVLPPEWPPDVVVPPLFPVVVSPVPPLGLVTLAEPVLPTGVVPSDEPVDPPGLVLPQKGQVLPLVLPIGVLLPEGFVVPPGLLEAPDDDPVASVEESEGVVQAPVTEGLVSAGPVDC